MAETKRIKIEVSNKEYNLLRFIRKEMPFGRCVLVTHNSEPYKIEEPKQIRFLEDSEEGREKPRDEGGH